MRVRWKKVDVLPAGTGLIVPADPSAWDKSIPVIWRYANRWVILSVENQRPYRLYYDDGNERRMHVDVLYSPYIAVRVAPKPICFFAIGTVRQHERTLRLVGESDLPEYVDDGVLTYV